MLEALCFSSWKRSTWEPFFICAPAIVDFFLIDPLKFCLNLIWPLQSHTSSSKSWQNSTIVRQLACLSPHPCFRCFCPMLKDACESMLGSICHPTMIVLPPRPSWTSQWLRAARLNRWASTPAWLGWRSWTLRLPIYRPWFVVLGFYTRNSDADVFSDIVIETWKST